MSTPEPDFTEDTVANDFVDAIDHGIVSEVGLHGRLRDYEWSGDDEDDVTEWPFTVVRDGREFEVDIDVRVTELTPERKAKREADLVELKTRLDAIAPMEPKP
jgi:hypothetical protein